MAPYAVVINGANAFPILESLSVQRGQGRQSTATLVLKAEPTVGHSVGIFDGAGKKLFGGTIDQVTPKPSNRKSDKYLYEAACVSYDRRLSKQVAGARAYGGTFVVDTGTNTATAPSHTLSNDQVIRVESTGTLPAPLQPNTDYYSRNVTADTFQISASAGGAAINLTTKGTGYHSFKWRAGDIVHHCVVTDLVGSQITHNGVQGGPHVQKQVYDGAAVVSNIIASLAQLVGFIYYVDPDTDLFFGPRNAVAAPFPITNTTKVRLLTPRHSREDYANRVVSRFPWSVISLSSEDFAGDDSTRRWTLSNPAAQIESMEVDGDPVQFGQAGVDGGLFYWVHGERHIYQEPSNDPLPSGSTLTVKYRALGENIATRSNSGEIAARATVEGDNGIYTMVITDQQSTTGQAVLDRADAELARGDQIATEFNYETELDGLEPGQLQNVNHTNSGTSGDFLIDQVTVRAMGFAALRYSVRALNVERLGDAADYFRALIGSDPGITTNGGGVPSVTQPGTVPPVSGLQALALTPGGSLPPGWSTNPHYTVDSTGKPFAGVSLRITPPNDANFRGTSMFVQVGSGDLEDVAFYVYPDALTLPAPHDVVVWRERPESAETWKFVAATAGQNTFNSPDPNDANSTVSVSITAAAGIPYPTITDVTVLGDLWENTQTPATRIDFTYTAPTAGEFTGVTLFLKLPGEAQFTAIAFYEHAGGANGASVSFTVYRDRPTANQTWEAVLSPRTPYHGEALFRAPDDRNYSSFSVQKTGSASATGITNAKVGDSGIPANEIGYLQDADGTWLWEIPEGITWTNPASDQNFFFARLTLQIVNSSGTPRPDVYGTERTVAEQQWPSHAVQVPIGPWGVLPASDPYRYYRFRLYSVDWDRNATLQTSAWGAGQDFINVNPQEQTGGLKLDRTDPATRGDGLEVASGKMRLKIQNGLEFTSGSVQVRIQGGGLEFSSGRLQVNTNGTEIGIDGSGQLQVNGVPAPKVLAGQLVIGVTLVGQQIIGGSIAATVAYLGQVNASQVNAGLFIGHSLLLTRNGVTTDIQNNFLGSEGGYGIKVYDSTYEHRMTPYFMGMYRNGSPRVKISSNVTAGGSITIQDSVGTTAVTMSATVGLSTHGGRDITSAGDLFYYGELRPNTYIASGSPALPAQYKIPLRALNGTFLGYLYAHP